jgi:hypothetical protein
MTRWLLALCIAAAASSPATASASIAIGHFDNSQVADVVIGAPYDDVNGKDDAGTVTLLQGGTGIPGNALPGLFTTARSFDQDTPGVPDAAQKGDHFGAALAVGDFNKDGFDDLAIGAPNEDLVGMIPALVKDAGVVTVLYGSPGGLTAENSFAVSRFTVGQVPKAGDRFGRALAAANFGRKGPFGVAYDDLAVGVPYADVRVVDGPLVHNAGAVHVLYGQGGASGLDTRESAVQTLTQETFDRGLADAGDHFGSALAAGDFGETLEDDLAIGVPYEDVAKHTNAGSVNVFYGSLQEIGLKSPAGRFAWHQSAGQVQDHAQDGDRFGAALAAADLGRSDAADLAIGVPTEDVFKVTDAGVVNVLYGGGPTGLTDVGNQLWHQRVDNIKGSPGTGDRFGASLSATNNVLAIGVPFESADAKGKDEQGETIPGPHHAGAVSVLYGDNTGLTDRDDLWHRNKDLPGRAARAGDSFGSSVAVALLAPELLVPDVMLVVGAPFVNLLAPSVKNAGAVNALYSRTAIPQLNDSGAQQFTQRTSGIPGDVEAGDQFGR